MMKYKGYFGHVENKGMGVSLNSFITQTLFQVSH